MKGNLLWLQVLTAVALPIAAVLIVALIETKIWHEWDWWKRIFRKKGGE